MRFKKYQNVVKNSKMFGKWYARAVVSETVTTDQLADEIQRNASVKKSDVKAVLCELSEVMNQKLIQGGRVVLDGIGAFKVTINTVGAETAKDFTANNIKSVRILFQPETRIVDNHRIKSMLNGIRLKEQEKYSSEEEENENENED